MGIPIAPLAKCEVVWSNLCELVALPSVKATHEGPNNDQVCVSEGGDVVCLQQSSELKSTYFRQVYNEPLHYLCSHYYNTPTHNTDIHT